MTWRPQGRRPSDTCEHDRRHTDRVGGVVRSVCSICGHVSFDLHPLEDREIDRERFARQADTAFEAAPTT